ncbi:MAG: hypothetical protein NVSMB25_19280 [Thermoleophilaceae bacterium]
MTENDHSSRARAGRALAGSVSYWPAELAIAAALVAYITLPDKLALGPRWLVPVLEGALLVGVAATTPRDERPEPALRRRIAIGLVALINVTNAVALGLLVHFLLHGGKAGGRELILSAVDIWATNVLIFALWYWEVDRGGPGQRARMGADTEVDFQFPQMLEPELAPKGWVPGFIDYLYLSFTNATAFSPTDTMPLTPVAKLLMTAESLVSLLTVVLVGARAVNILQ